MSKYFHVTEGQIDDGPRDVPTSWKNVSGLDHLDDAALKAKGWLPQEIVGFTPFDPDTQTRTGPVNVVQVDRVVSTYTVADKSLAGAKTAKRESLKQAFEARGLALVSGYASTERETWPEQAKAAQAYQADPGGTHTYLTGLTLDSQTLADTATAILAKRDAFLAASAGLVKHRRALDAQIEAAATVAAVRAVDVSAGWPF